MRISPSKFQYWATCPCFEYKQGDGSAAAEGTRLHEAMETDTNDTIETEEEQAQVNKMREYRANVEASFPISATKVAEVEVKLFDGIKGTLDHCVVDFENKRAAILDWKSGRLGLPSSAADNLQGRGYCLGLFWLVKQFVQGHTLSLGQTLESIEFHLVAPRTGEIDSVVYTKDQMDGIELELRNLVARVDDPFKVPRNRDPDICGTCNNLPRCPAASEAIEPVVVKSTPLPVPNDIFGALDQMTPLDISKFMVINKIVTEFFDGKKKAINQFVFDQNIEVPGYKKVTRAGRSKISDVPDAIEDLKRVMDEVDIFNCCSLSITKLRKFQSDVDETLAAYLERGPDTKFLQKTRGLDTEKLLTEGVISK